MTGPSKTEEMKVTIVSPERTIFEGEVSSVTVPGEKGRFEVLRNHAPIISCLQKGTILCSGKETQTFDITSGFIEVANNEISICVEV